MAQNGEFFPTMSGKSLEKSDIDEILAIYRPKKWQMDSDIRPQGAKESQMRAQKLRSQYEREKGVKYDYFLTTRFDILFFDPLKIAPYFALYDNHPELKWLPKHDKINFCPMNPFRVGVIDLRYPNESDLLFFSNYCDNRGVDFYNNGAVLNILPKYFVGWHFDMLRERYLFKQKARNFIKAILRKFGLFSF